MDSQNSPELKVAHTRNCSVWNAAYCSCGARLRLDAMREIDPVARDWPLLSPKWFRAIAAEGRLLFKRDVGLVVRWAQERQAYYRDSFKRTAEMAKGGTNE